MVRLIDSIRQKKPLVHCISNIVTANDCANLLLAIGASPIMAQAPEEMSEITALADALVLNTGTPDKEKYAACRIAGMTANQRGIPLILDPVGVGASRWRLENGKALLESIKPTIIRANHGEACALLGIQSLEHGVDSTASGSANSAPLAKALAEKYRCTVLLSGTEDIVSDGKQTVFLSGGSPLMKQITGAGCMLSCLCGAFASVASPQEAAEAAAKLWKAVAAQAEQTAAGTGLGNFHASLFDATSRLNK